MTRELDSHKLEEERGGTRGKWVEWMGGGGLAENHLKQGKQMKEMGGGRCGLLPAISTQDQKRKKSSAFNIHHTTGVVASTLRVCMCGEVRQREGDGGRC